SFFSARKERSDSRSYWDTPTVHARGFEMDWARINSERLSSVLLPYKIDNDESARRAELEMGRLRLVVESHKRGERLWSWSMAKFMRFVDECAVAEPGSENCRLTDLENIFVSSTSSEPISPSRATPDTFLLSRHQLIGCLARIAVLKFASERAHSIAWAFHRLLADCIKPEAPPIAFVDRDVFRVSKLYSPEAEDVITKYYTSIKVIFEFFAGFDDKAAARPYLLFDDWQQLMSDAEMFDSIFTRKEAALCFIMSQPFVADEVRGRGGRRLEGGGTRGRRYTEWCTHNAPSWEVEQQEGRHIDEAFSKILFLLIARLDVEHIGVVTAKGLAKHFKRNGKA
ncbi:MAG: hypothetical protein SGPRY_007723, partial [Prymnesium sp.]